MSKTLDQRLEASERMLARVQTALGRHPGRLPTEVESTFRTLIDYRTDIASWRELAQVRAVTAGVLTDLERTADAADNVPLGTKRVKFAHARFVGVVSHLATTWALADRVSGFVGRMLCTPQAGLNSASPPQLVSHFINRELTKKSTAATLFESVRQSFGWPVGLSYAIRNHFVHDGAQAAGTAFFEGSNSASAFRISTDAWNRLEHRAVTDYNVERSFQRAGAAWPAIPTDDLRAVLRVTDHQIDEALGVLLGSACGSLAIHIEHLLGED